MTNSPNILVVDDDQSLRRVLTVQLEQLGYSVLAAASGEEALNILARHSVSLVLTDFRMPGMSGMELLTQIHVLYPEIIVIILTAFGTIGTAVEAMKAGAYHYITKPVDPDELKLVLERSLEHFRMAEEIRCLRRDIDQKYGFENILGHSEVLLSVLERAARVARTSSTVLIQGETGTGKELLAKAIHYNSPRKDRLLVTINCGAIPKELLESELFGYTKGSFTGAIGNKRGKIEMADGGTLFLDEIGEMPLELQVKILRLLQEGEIEKVGAVGGNKVDVRVVAATHRNLPSMIEEGTFREDLYYRLAVIPLALPPLRERAEDIPELVEKFFLRNKNRNGRPELVLPPELLPYFSHYRWPGNVRQIENVVEQIVVLARGEEVTVNDLPEFLRRNKPPSEALELHLPPEGISLEGVEKDLIMRAMKKFEGNQSQAARYLDISRKTLLYRLEKHGIK